MSNKWGTATLVACVGLLFAADLALAQAPGGGRGRFGSRSGIVGLAGNEAVQKELGLDDAAKEKLAAVLRSFAEEAREQMQSIGNFQDASADERQQMMAKLTEMNQKLTAKFQPKIKESLSADQYARLQQINWQASGAQAFTDPELAKALDLTGEQKERISAVVQDFQQKQRGLFGGGDVQAAIARMRELTQERDTKAVEVLSKDQQEKFTELKGKPFDLAQLQQGGPGGRQRPGSDKN